MEAKYRQRNLHRDVCIVSFAVRVRGSSIFISCKSCCSFAIPPPPTLLLYAKHSKRTRASIFARHTVCVCESACLYIHTDTHVYVKSSLYNNVSNRVKSSAACCRRAEYNRGVPRLLRRSSKSFSLSRDSLVGYNVVLSLSLSRAHPFSQEFQSNLIQFSRPPCIALFFPLPVASSVSLSLAFLSPSPFYTSPPFPDISSTFSFSRKIFPFALKTKTRTFVCIYRERDDAVAWLQ